MTTQSYLLLVVGVSHLLFGLIVLLKGYRKSLNRIFFFTTIFFAIWNLAMGSILSDLIENANIIVLLDRITYFVIPMLFIFLIIYFR
jgi:hypothetical protein